MSGSFDFSRLNPAQKDAVCQTEGPLLLIAGPGTGKTHTLVQRIAYLVSQKGVLPSQIMAVTFTRKAAKELLTRISDEFLRMETETCGGSAEDGIHETPGRRVMYNLHDMYIGTFHSLCLRMMKEHPKLLEEAGGALPRVMDAFEQVYLVYRNLDQFRNFKGFSRHFPSSLGAWRQAQKICKYVGQLQEELVDLEAMEQDADPDIQLLAKLVKRYQELLARSGAIDFSGIQTRTLQMLQEHPDILASLQEEIRYILVDEYQDTNYIQEQLVFALAGKRQNLCVVGDDDQGLYRFRGATIRNILEFPEKFAPGQCPVIYLEQNYRSQPDIIRFYRRWMEEEDIPNPFTWGCCRFPKQIRPVKETASSGESVYRCGGASRKEAGDDLAEMIRGFQARGNITDLNQVAVLFSSVKGTEAMEIGACLEAQGIPVYSPRSDLFFAREEVQQMLGCLLCSFLSYLSDFKRRSFRIKITDELWNYYKHCIQLANRLWKEYPKLYQAVREAGLLVRNADSDSGTGLLSIFYGILSQEPFAQMMQTEQAKLCQSVYQTRAVRNLAELSRLLARFCALHQMHGLTAENKVALPEEFFNEYLKCLIIDGIGEYEDEGEYAPSGCVSFLTIHQSKGLEFPVVVVGSLGNAPRARSDSLMLTAQLRLFQRKPFEPFDTIKYFDFWRLYYTAFSRARNLLVLLQGKENMPEFDRYFRELPPVQRFLEDKSGCRDVFDPVRRIRYKAMYSFTSHISLYDGCPTQYLFYKEYGFAQNQMFHTSVGSLVHATLEDLNNWIIQGKGDAVDEEMVSTWFCLNYQVMQEHTGYYLTTAQQDMARSQVVRYYIHRQGELGRAWKAEEEIRLVLPEFILQGIVDLIEGQGDTVEIVDYKTGPKPDPGSCTEQLEHYRKQLELYAYLVEQRYGKQVSRMHLYYTSTLEGDPLVSYDWNRQAVEGTIREIGETVWKIEHKEFREKARNRYACKYCDFRALCHRDGE